MQITTEEGNYQLCAHYLEKNNDLFKIRLSWTPTSWSFSEVLQQAGHMPLPPYIKRAAASEDAERYQTVFAQEEGSVAAPTAGLHFTKRVLQRLQAKNIRSSFVTLHVGAGTFQPVKVEAIGDHPMHSEYIEISRAWIQQYLMDPATITAVGTTSLRTLESMYWMGVKTYYHPNIDITDMPISQWEVYEIKDEQISLIDAFKALEKWMHQQKLEKFMTTTQIMIAPGYRFRVVDRLVTNFHQPQSTLLLLIAAFMGDEWKAMYQYALENDFRFLSYGDGCLLQRKN
jgi:S-adenosylmethionine:tRNA ribosyltransferase-isomerase